MYSYSCFFFFFFNDTATTEIYTLSLHDALPIFVEIQAQARLLQLRIGAVAGKAMRRQDRQNVDRKSTRLNSSHANISYAVFCLKKKKKKKQNFKRKRTYMRSENQK